MNASVEAVDVGDGIFPVEHGNAEGNNENNYLQM